MKGILQAIRLTFISVAFIGTSGLPMMMNTPSALAVLPKPQTVDVSLNRPSSVWVGSVIVAGRCLAIIKSTCTTRCISLSQQNQPYPVGSYILGSTINIKRFSDGTCNGDVNPQDQQVTLTKDLKLPVDIQNWV
jgi:hypothetical protein